MMLSVAIGLSEPDRIWRAVLALVFAATTSTVSTSAQTSSTPSAPSSKRAMTFEDIMALRSLGSVEMSPNGQYVAYTISEWDLGKGAGTPAGTGAPTRHSHIWLANTVGARPRQLTFSDRGESGPQWSPDGTTIAFVSSRDGTDAGEKSQIWLLPMDGRGGEARQLTHAPNGAGAFEWSPDGSRIAYLSADSLPQATEAARRRKDDAQAFESDFRFTHLYVVDIATGGEEEVAHGNFTLSALAISSVPHWSPDGTRIAFVASPTTLLRDLRGGVYIVTVANRRIEKIAPEFRSAAGALTQPVWSPDGKMLVFTNFPQSSTLQGDGIPEPLLGNGQLVLYDLATKQSKHISDQKVDVTLSQLKWTPDGESLLFTAPDSAYQSVFRYDVRTDNFSRVTTRMMVHDISMDRNGSRVAFRMDTPTSPSDVYLTDLRFDSPRRLTNINPQVARFALGRSEVITWKSSDGTSVQGILLEPAGFRTGRRYPLLVEEHGGPTDMSSNDFKGTSSSPGQVWAGRGWAVLYPNPRGSEGYGEKFMLANIRDLGGGDYRDIMAGVDDVIRLGIADSSKMAFEGWSYGGYMTAWVVGHTSRFKAARMGAGMSDLMSMYGASEIPGYNGLLEGGMPSEKTFATYREESPITYADSVTTPLLILHGAADPRVPTGQSLEFYRALKDRGKTVELVLYPREQHGFTEYYHLLDRMRRDYAWITKYTLGSTTAAVD